MHQASYPGPRFLPAQQGFHTREQRLSVRPPKGPRQCRCSHQVRLAKYQATNDCFNGPSGVVSALPPGQSWEMRATSSATISSSGTGSQQSANGQLHSEEARYPLHRRIAIQGDIKSYPPSAKSHCGRDSLRRACQDVKIRWARSLAHWHILCISEHASREQLWCRSSFERDPPYNVSSPSDMPVNWTILRSFADAGLPVPSAAARPSCVGWRLRQRTCVLRTPVCEAVICRLTAHASGSTNPSHMKSAYQPLLRRWPWTSYLVK